MSELEEFYERLNAEVIGESQAYVGNDGELVGGGFKENAFTQILIEELGIAGVLESPTACYFEDLTGPAIKANGYGIPEDDSRLDIVITAFFPDEVPKRLQKLDLEKILNSASRFFQAATKGLYQRLETGSDKYGMCREIFDHQTEFDRVQIILITNGLAVQRKEIQSKTKADKWVISYDIWDLERIRRFRSSGATHEPITVDLTSFDGGVRCVSASSKTDGFQTCVAIFPGIVLHDWYDDFGSRMLELNVRSYLQARGKINTGILETLLKEPERFLSYNNGITIVAEQIDFNSERDRIVGIRGLQIVNGGQTTASIHRAMKENQADLSKVYVQAKITVVPADVFEAVVPDISRYSNTQNKVTEVDLGANHGYHVGIERVAMNTWAPGEQSMWFYERARGSYQTLRARSGSTKVAKDRFDIKFPVSQKISKEELARYTNTWAGHAAVVNRGGQKNFVKFMESLPSVEKNWEPTREQFREIVGKCILFRDAQAVAKKLKLTAHGINIVIYTVALIAEKTARRIDLQSIWASQHTSSNLSALIERWMPQIAQILKASAGERNLGEWLKQEGCWKQLKEATSAWALPADVSSQLVTASGVEITLPDSVHNAIAQCMSVEASTWFQIQVWGSKSGKLQTWQIGIANTLSGYAAANWIRRPSTKQASFGVKILEIYVNENSANIIQ